MHLSKQLYGSNRSHANAIDNLNEKFMSAVDNEHTTTDRFEHGQSNLQSASKTTFTSERTESDGGRYKTTELMSEVLSS
jgi:hypothetical protein